MKQVKKIIAMILLLSMILPMASCGSALMEEVTATVETVTEEVDTAPVVEVPKATKHPIKELEGYLRLLGERSMFTEANLLSLEWVGCGFELTLSVPEEGTEVLMHSRFNYGSTWVVFVDGVRSEERLTIGNGNQETLLCFLEAGTHTVRVEKDTQQGTNKENYNNIVALTYLGEAIPSDQTDKEYFIEFLGDGYFTGFGSLGNKAESSDIAAESSYHATVPYLVTSALNADYSVVAHSQMGLQKKAGGQNLLSLYKKNLGWRDAAILYTPDRIPDAIVIHAGYDDSGLTQAQFIEEGLAFVDYVRSFYGKEGKNIPVIWLYGTLYYTTRANALKIIGIKGHNIHPLQLEYGRNGAGTKDTVRYPNLSDNQKSAEILINYLQEKILKK